MTAVAIEKTDRTIKPALRGYHAVYRENQVNYCPGCGRTHWMIGRTTAECGFCATALPLDFSLATPTETAVIAVNDNHQKIKRATHALKAPQPDVEANDLQNLRGVFNNSARGYHAVYRDDQVNHCPGCGRTHWFKGRLSAECGFCATALPLASALSTLSETAMIFSHDNHRLAKGEGSPSNNEGAFDPQ